ncbi:MAG: shikimate kinase [Desulfitobacteriaceae bacterium]
MKDLQNIILIGFMGTGKSTVGRRLAMELNWRFIDTDLVIEEVTGLTISSIFRRYGESRFRSEESLVVKKISSSQHCIISTGGGTVLNSENFEILLQSGFVICLYASLEAILQRVGNSDRPLLKRSPADIVSLWQSRQEIYARAPYTVDTTNKGVEEVVNEILRLLEKGVQ